MVMTEEEALKVPFRLKRLVFKKTKLAEDCRELAPAKVNPPVV